MDINAAAGMAFVGQYPVGGIGIINAQGEVKIAERVKMIDLIKALRHPPVTFATLGTFMSGGRTDGIVFYEPELRFSFFFAP